MRGNALHASDPSGQYTIDANCDRNRGRVEKSLFLAADGLLKCGSETKCSAIVRRRAVAALLLGHVRCVNYPEYETTCAHTGSEETASVELREWVGRIPDWAGPQAAWFAVYTAGTLQNLTKRPNWPSMPSGGVLGLLEIEINTRSFDALSRCNLEGKCPARTMAHEALHLAGLPSVPGISTARYIDPTKGVVEAELKDEDANLNQIATDCVTCN